MGQLCRDAYRFDPIQSWVYAALHVCLVVVSLTVARRLVRHLKQLGDAVRIVDERRMRGMEKTWGRGSMLSGVTVSGSGSGVEAHGGGDCSTSGASTHAATAAAVVCLKKALLVVDEEATNSNNVGAAGDVKEEEDAAGNDAAVSGDHMPADLSGHNKGGEQKRHGDEKPEHHHHEHVGVEVIDV